MTLNELATLAITSSSVILAFFSVFVAWYIGRRFREHVNEIARISNEHRKVREELERSNNQNAKLGGMAALVGRALFDYSIVLRNIQRVEKIYEDLSGKGSVAVSEAALERLMVKELSDLYNRLRAREHDLYTLVEGSSNRSAYLESIAWSVGDEISLRLVRNLEKSGVSDWDREELIRARVRLEVRLGIVGDALIGYRSKDWTGR